MKRSRPLTTAELVEAAVLADVSVLLIVVGWFLPASGAFWAAAVVPLAALMVRHRVRALIVGAVAGGAIASLALGFGMVFQVGAAALVAYVVGTSMRRRWGIGRTIAMALGMGWTLASAVFVAFLGIFSASRKLTLDQLRVQWTGAKRVAAEVLKRGDELAKRTHANPAVFVVALELFPVAVGVAFARSVRRVQRVLLGIIAGAYVALCAAFNVWAGAIAVAALAAGFVASGRLRSMHPRAVIARVWVALGALTLLAGAAGGRRLFVSTLDVQWRFVRATATTWLGIATRVGDTTVTWFLVHWWIAVPLSLIIPVVGVTVVARGIAIPVLARVDRAIRRPPASDAQTVTAGPAGPVPAVFEDVSYVYHGASAPALDHVSLEIPSGAYVGVLGDNGSGKSTLARILGGADPTSGVVRRPGSAAPGVRGGVAMIFQRPESQVLGVRVREDVTWGMPPDAHPDVASLLALVGLEGFGDRETATLSGGELQRLALAAAMAREPKLIVSDESTAMVDPDGRAEIVRVFRRLADDGVTVVHITHRAEECNTADVVVVLGDGRVLAHGEPRAVLART